MGVEKKNHKEVLGLKNLTNRNVIGITPSGKENVVSHGEVIPVKAGIRIKIFDDVIIIQ